MQKNTLEKRVGFIFIFFVPLLILTGCTQIPSKPATVNDSTDTVNVQVVNNVVSTNTSTDLDVTTLSWKDFSSPLMSYAIQYPEGYPDEWDTWSGSQLYDDLNSPEMDTDFFTPFDREYIGSEKLPYGYMRMMVGLTLKRDGSMADIIAEQTKVDAVSDSEQITISGLPAVQQVEQDTRDPDDQYGYDLETYVDADSKKVYNISWIFDTKQTYEKNKDLVDYMIASFKSTTK